MIVGDVILLNSQAPCDRRLHTAPVEESSGAAGLRSKPPPEAQTIAGCLTTLLSAMGGESFRSVPPRFGSNLRVSPVAGADSATDFRDFRIANESQPRIGSAPPASSREPSLLTPLKKRPGFTVAWKQVRGPWIFAGNRFPESPVSLRPETLFPRSTVVPALLHRLNRFDRQSGSFPLALLGR